MKNMIKSPLILALGAILLSISYSASAGIIDVWVMMTYSTNWAQRSNDRYLVVVDTDESAQETVQRIKAKLVSEGVPEDKVQQLQIRLGNFGGANLANFGDEKLYNIKYISSSGQTYIQKESTLYAVPTKK